MDFFNTLFSKTLFFFDFNYFLYIFSVTYVIWDTK